MLGTSKSVWGFDPRSVPGCQLWLDAADPNAMTLSGSSVTQWRDKSGSSNNFTPTSGTPTLISDNGRNVVNFTSGAIMRSANQITFTTSSAFFIVSRLNLVNASNGGMLLVFTDIGGGDFSIRFFSSILFSGNGNDLALGAYYVNGTFNPSFGSSTYLNTYSLIGTVAPQSGGTSYLAFSSSFYERYFIGNIAEFLYYPGGVTSSQRQQIEGYLAHKWGLTGYYDSSIPLSIPGCQLWLDGADPAATGVTPSNGATVSTWVDKSGNGLTVSAASSQPTYVTNAANGLGTVAFNGSQGLSAGTVTGTKLIGNTNSCAIYAVVRFENTSGRSIPYSWDDQTYEARFLLQYAEGNSIALLKRGATATTIPLINSLYYIVSYWQNGLNTQLNVNGTTIASLSNFSNNDISSFSRVFNVGYYANDPSGWNMRGNIAEIIFFNTHIPNDFKKVEGYLARKWGLTSMYSALPSTHPFSSIRPHLRTFQPTDIPGCQLWLDAADSSSLVLSGSSVTQMRDKSPNLYTLTGSVGTYPTRTATMNGLPVISSANGQYLAISNFNQNFLTATSFMVIRPTQDLATVPGLYNSYVVISGTMRGIIETGMLMIPDGAYYSFFFQSGYGFLSANSLIPNPINKNILISGVVSGNAATSYTYINGSLRVSNAESGTFAQHSSQTLYCFGRPSGSYGYDIAETLIYNTALTLSQIQQIEGYLAHKWGLTPSYSPTTPLSIPGCSLWLDAADSSTITGTSSVTAWRDKTSSLTLTGSGSTYTTVSGYPAITFNGNQFVSSTNIPYERVCTSNANFTTFIVQLTTSSSGVNGIPFTIYLTGNVRRFAVFSSGGGSGGIFIDGASQASPRLGGITQTLNTPQLLSITRKNITTMTARLNGSQVSSSDFPGTTDFISSNSYFVFISNGTGPWSGNMYEIIHYNRDLSDLEIQQMEGYLANKWGIGSSSIPFTHPFKSFPPASLPFSPRNISGLQLWLDGRDTSSMTFSGSSITQWNDKSGNGYNATISSGRIGATFSSALNCVYFQSSSVGYQTSYPANPTNESMFIVANIDSPSSINNNTLICGQQGARSLGIGWNGTGATNASAYLNSQVAWQTSTPAGSYTAGTTALITGQVSGGSSLSIAMNGATFSTGGGGGYYAGTTTHLGVDTTTTAYYYKGFVMEILFYNSVLTTSQRQQVEGYLAQKWGLTTSLPATHPYVKLPA